MCIELSLLLIEFGVVGLLCSYISTVNPDNIYIVVALLKLLNLGISLLELGISAL